ncbi:MAG TPA: TolC family protein, partial [Candidatus Binataceae bacterium]|nr:TolC family protein [Candidatus Binataceae bacterium]
MLNAKTVRLGLMTLCLIIPLAGRAWAQQPAANIGLGAQTVPEVNVPAHATHQYESNPIVSIPKLFVGQWRPGGESLPPERYSMGQNEVQRRLTLKETIYIALRSNPGLAAVALDPIAATESVKGANAAFDPNLSSQVDVEKEVSPVSSPFQNPGTIANATKYYDWNFGVNKVLATTNATFGLLFENNRELTNSAFNPVNPVYTPLLEMSLSQPLLQNFGWQFATINVRMAQSAQRSQQWNYGSSLNDFVQHIGNDYWGVVAAEENLQVAQAALKFNNDLVRVNGENVSVGMMAPVNLDEARSAAATARANLDAAQAALETARTTLRQDVTLNPGDTLLGEDIEPVQQPDTRTDNSQTAETALEKMLEYSPALAGLREAIVTSLLQVKYAENQTLPQLNFGGEFGLTSEAGNTKCTSSFTVPSYANCFNPNGPMTGKPFNAAVLPFGGEYSDALNRMFDARFYNYAALLTFSMPLDNASAKAALAQARISYNQARLQYREALFQAVLQVKSALSNLAAYRRQVTATKEATYYANKSLDDVNSQFEVGLATTNQVLQYQSNLVTAQGNE